MFKDYKNAYINGIYTKICKNKNLEFIKDKTTIRLSVDEGDPLGKLVAEQMGDFVIYKKILLLLTTLQA